MFVEYNEVGFINAYNKNVERRVQAMYVMELIRNNRIVRCSATHWNGIRSKMIEAGVVLQNIHEIDKAYIHRADMLTQLKNAIAGMTAEEVTDFEDNDNWSKIGVKVVL